MITPLIRLIQTTYSDWKAIFVIVLLLVLPGCLNNAFHTPMKSAAHKSDTEISGLVKIRPNGYLFVRDWKSGRHSGPRLAFLELGDAGLTVEDIAIEGLASKDQPNDVESICSIRDGLDEYLVVESGYVGGKFGRILRIKIYEEGERWKAHLLGSFHPIRPNDSWKELTTPSAEQIEGIGCVVDQSNRLWILLGKRGGKGDPGSLIWGEVKDFNSPGPRFFLAGEQSLDDNPLGDRAIAEIYLEPLRSEGWRVWTAATVDEGNQGPFQSMIYSPGRFYIDPLKGAMFSLNRHPDSWVIEGLKVEGIAAPPTRIPISAMAVGTDDEDYKGIWRSLPKHPFTDTNRRE